MNKIIIALTAVMVVIGAMFTAVILFHPNHKEEAPGQEIQEIAQEEILDDCTDEYEQMEYDNTVKVNTRRRKNIT